jgi:hypothetical protein
LDPPLLADEAVADIEGIFLFLLEREGVDRI